MAHTPSPVLSTILSPPAALASKAESGNTEKKRSLNWKRKISKNLHNMQLKNKYASWVEEKKMGSKHLMDTVHSSDLMQMCRNSTDNKE